MPNSSTNTPLPLRRRTRRISAHEAIRLIPRVLVLEEITLGQSPGVLAERTEGDDDPEQQGHNPQAMDSLRQIQAGEP